jgi:hypothetical protein
MMSASPLKELVSRIADRDAQRTEADVQSDIKTLLTSGALEIADNQVASLEVSLGDSTRRRIDIEVGNMVIEVKKDLRRQGILEDAISQLSGYVSTQSTRLKTRYVGVLTDGAEWILYYFQNSTLSEVSRLTVNSKEPEVDRLIVWLESVLATQLDIKPTPKEIELRLGVNSASYQLDHVNLLDLFAKAKNKPEVSLKKDLWAKLLRTALGSAFTDDPRLFVDHTLLVLTAEIIAHAVVGFDLTDSSLSPSTLARGEAFAGAQIYGVVEADFFDWVLEVPGGADFIRSLARRIGRFDWNNVRHDVLKILYESVINAQTRKSLGEYYTPDWLADRIVDRMVDAPLSQRVLDPSCGSGTFLFHAIRQYLAAADKAGLSNADTLGSLTSHVAGVDVHPVSVTLARVTYLLAIGTERLSDESRRPLSVPVYLGDSIQWDQHTGVLSQGEVRVATSGTDLVDAHATTLFSEDLVFPERVVDNVDTFDRLIVAMADKATQHKAGSKYPSINAIMNTYGVHENDRSVLTETFNTMCRLHADGRDHIWSYYVRNLIRPLWLSSTKNKVDVLVGNPPWLAYRFMTEVMQKRFTKLGKEHRLITGRLGVSGRDLSALFIARSVDLYLKPDGKFGFVVPRAALSRQQYEGFRSGAWSSPVRAELDIKFDVAWDLDGVRPHIFPVPAGVVTGTFAPRSPQSLKEEVEVWNGKLPEGSVDWSTAQSHLSVTAGHISQVGAESPVSVYKSRFRQGAIIVPRVLLLAEKVASGPLGVGVGRVSVRSRRSAQEKEPWKSVPSLSGTVETQFLRSTLLGETTLPFRISSPLTFVLPAAGGRFLSVEKIEEYPGLSQWWNKAQALWDENKSKSDKGTLLDRIDFHGQLSSQLSPSAHRVVYAKAGIRLAAARIDDSHAIVDHTLYWGAASSLDEARYLVAMLNSSAVQEVAEKLQSRGQFGARHFDKYVWHAPIPVFDRAMDLHREIVELSERAEVVASSVDLSAVNTFQRAREEVRKALVATGISERIDVVVRETLAS